MFRLDSSGKPTHVQVSAPGGHSVLLAIDLYEPRGVLSDWRKLPTDRQHKALLAVYQIEQGSSVFINAADAEECESPGWLESVGTNGWRLAGAAPFPWTG
jgi:hypothetical protein